MTDLHPGLLKEWQLLTGVRVSESLSALSPIPPTPEGLGGFYIKPWDSTILMISGVLNLKLDRASHHGHAIV